MDLLLIFLLSLPIILLFLLPKFYKNGKEPPGPKGLPFIGNLHQIDNSAIHGYLANLSEKYGPLMSLRLGSRPAIVVSSAAVAEDVLKTHDLIFAGRPSMLGQQKLSYNGLDIAFTQYSEYWRELRKICALHLFSAKRVESFRPIRIDEVCRVIKEISQQACSKQPINLSELALALTSNIICRTAFGKRLDDDDFDRSRFVGLIHELQAHMVDFFVSDYFPLFRWVDKLTGKILRLEKNFRDFDLFYQELIDERLSNSNRPVSSQPDILDILLRLRAEMSLSSSFSFCFDHIKALLMNIFIGGTDTTAASIIWAMTELMKLPSAMKRVQEEIRNEIGKNNKDMVDEGDVQRLSYLKAVIKESFRLHPPAPLLVPHESMQECVIRGYEIKPKTIVYINAWAIARDPESWENPDDFSPERFLSNNDAVDFTGQNFKFIPFGAGRRGCPGTSLGLATVEIALANLLYSFDWELPIGMKIEDIDTKVLPGVTMHKKNDLCLVAKNYVKV